MDVSGQAGRDPVSGIAPGIGARIVMLSGSILLSASVVSLQPVLPHIEEELATSDTDRLLIKMLVAVLNVTMMVGAPVAGYLADRFSIRRLAILFGLWFSVAGLSGFFLNSIYALLLSRLLVGIASASIVTISLTLVNTTFDGNARARWVGYHIAASMCGSLAILVIVGQLGEIGWRYTFLIYLIGLVFAGIAALGMRDTRAADISTTMVEASREDGRRAVDDGNPLRWFPMWFVPLAFCTGSITYMSGVYLPFLLRDIGVHSPSYVATIMLADAVVGAAMSFLFGRSRRYFSTYATFIVAFALTGMGMAVAALSSTLTVLVIGMLLYGLGLGWFTPTLIHAISRRVASYQQGRGVGFAKSIHYISSPIIILLLEPLLRTEGPRGAMLAGSAMSALVVLVFIVLLSRPSTRAGDHIEAKVSPTA